MQHTTHVTDSSFRQKRSERDDLANLVAPVFLLNVLDHLFAAIHAEIDVEIRHRNPLGVQETFEKKRVTQRIKVGDRQSVRNERTGPRSAARSDRDVMILGPFDEVRHDQEVAGEPHAFDNVEFEVEAFLVFLDRGCMWNDL